MVSHYIVTKMMKLFSSEKLLGKQSFQSYLLTNWFNELQY